MSGLRGIGLFVGCMTDLFVEESRDGNGKCEDVARIVVSFTWAGAASGAPTKATAKASVAASARTWHELW
jgi:hypothetical protein